MWKSSFIIDVDATDVNDGDDVKFDDEDIDVNDGDDVEIDDDDVNDGDDVETDGIEDIIDADEVEIVDVEFTVVNAEAVVPQSCFLANMVGL